MTPEELKSMVEGLNSKINELKSAEVQTKATQEEIDALKAKLAEMEAEMTAENEEAMKFDSRITEMEKKMNRPNFMVQAVQKSIGASFVEKAFVDGEIKMNKAFEVKAISNATGSAEGLTTNMRVPDIFANPNRPVFIRDLIKKIPVMDSAVEIMRENVFTNSAAMQTAELAAKGESNITFTQETIAVQTLAHFLIASRQILADQQRLQAHIDNRMQYGLNLSMDSQLLYGDGTGTNFTGLFVDTGVSDVGEIATGTTDADLPAAMIDHIRAAITQCQVYNYYNVNGIVMNPTDWATIETAKGTDGHYIWASVTEGGVARMWKVPVIVSSAVTAGDFILGDWNLGCTIYDRESMTIRVSESHADYFTKNGIAILGEERAAFAIELPKAFCKGQFTVAAA